jgi:hypothetical protein
MTTAAMSYANPWTKVAVKPSEQTFECEMCAAEVVAEIDMAQAERELAHATGQIAIQVSRPGARELIGFDRDGLIESHARVARL